MMALAVRAALQRWSRAFNHISRRRRHNILNAVILKADSKAWTVSGHGIESKNRIQ
ncbi:hypothetical protein GHT06_008968 [Daphnia sinensis]|uniref:Uncharacterized protein n=1 Tax=Daphnia sinensis TaxID=1820382 RepID=A0AAD5L290_9CRUS|nr:hypothetical protein GHT06_008968 [Daphnia sinensis]